MADKREVTRASITHAQGARWSMRICNACDIPKQAGQAQTKVSVQMGGVFAEGAGCIMPSDHAVRTQIT